MEATDSASAPAHPGELSLDDALRFAIKLHEAGNLDDAETVYRRIIEVVPEAAGPLHFLALLVRQRGKRGEAIELMRRAIAVDPAYASAHNNLGNLLCEQGDFEEARACLKRALELSPEDPGTLSNLGMVERALGYPEKARELFEKAVALAPEFAIPYENLGRHYYRLGDIVRAHDNFCRAVVFDPTLCYSRQFMGLALSHLGRLEEARVYYRKWIEAEPGNPVPRHLLASVSAEPMPARASDSYVKSVFDTFASTFDVHLQRLEYRAPELVVDALRESGLPAGPELDILDAGCGTGLCGALLRDCARTLVGVDLSPGMLEKARSSGRYDELTETELTAFMNAHPACWDAITCADTLCYFGDLREPVAAAAAALRPGGRFVFSVEMAEPGVAPDGFCLRHSGRYAHTAEHVKRTLSDAGLEEVSITRQVLRMDAGAPVAGLIAVAVRIQGTSA